jgi:hypothetical protein
VDNNADREMFLGTVTFELKLDCFFWDVTWYLIFFFKKKEGKKKGIVDMNAGECMRSAILLFELNGGWM